VTPPPILPDQRRKDAEHLKLLAFFHFIVAGLGVLALGFLYFQYRFTEGSMNYDAAVKANAGAAESIHFFIRFFKAFYLVLGGMDVLCAIGNVASGFCIRRRKYRALSLIMAGLNCLRLSLGAVLGVFTFIVLLRKSVREAYDSPSGDAPNTSPDPIADHRTPISVAPPAQPTPPPMPLIPPEDRQSLSAPPPIAASEADSSHHSLQGEATADATGGIIPYKNPPALIAYYCGVFSIIPFLGFFIGIAALCLGIAGLKKRKQTPIIRGSVHAWIGIICGSLSIVAHLAVVALIIGASRH